MTDKTKEFIDKAIEVHGDKYDYSKVEYIKAKDKIIIICKEHNIFEQNPHKHLSGQGCPKCIGKNNTTLDFIEKSKEIHGNKYDYSKTIYENNLKEVIIICKIHGDFLQLPKTHKRGNGCIKCSGKYKYSTEEWISMAKELHGNEYDYSNTIYKNANEKIIINCRIHGEFEQTPSGHLNTKYCCPKCNLLNIGKWNSSNQYEFIDKAKIKHDDRYDYSKVKYIKSNEKVIIICNIHGEFLQTPSHHLDGQGCNDCGIEKTANIKRSNIDEFIKKSREIHENKYDYSKSLYVNCDKNIIIICKNHGEFEQTPYHHLKGCGCPNCGYELIGIKKRSNKEEFIEKSKEIHGDKYDYSKVIYNKKDEKVIIICKSHGEFYQEPNSHKNGCGCPYCGREMAIKNMTYTTEEFIEISKQIHCNKYDYSKTDYIKRNEKVNIICKNHGIFTQSASNHMKGSGCPKCALRQHSKSQIKWLNFHQIYKNIYIQHFENIGEFLIPTTKYKADGYCKETNTIYEFHGDYWHGNPKVFDKEDYNKTTNCTFGDLYQKTLEREQQIKDLGYNLVVMWEYDWNIINKFIRKIQQKFRNSKLLV